MAGSCRRLRLPGVAQRTGTTVYYLEMSAPPRAPERRPVFALMPVSGRCRSRRRRRADRSGPRGGSRLVTPERTTVVASTHRIYGITEKSAMGDGIVDGNAVFAALHARSKRLIGFDMQALAEEHRSVISSILFGAIAASGVLPFPRALYEQAITQSGVAVQSNLAGFAAGFERALQRSPIDESRAAWRRADDGARQEARRTDQGRISGAPAWVAAGRRATLRRLPGWRAMRICISIACTRSAIAISARKVLAAATR